MPMVESVGPWKWAGMKHMVIVLVVEAVSGG